MFFLFFFQAEDGIRDTSVTGVQTCALPIWNWLRAALGCEGEVAECVHGEEAREEREREQVARSEERRVGKECRSRWSPCHSKEKTKRVKGMRIESKTEGMDEHDAKTKYMRW